MSKVDLKLYCPACGYIEPYTRLLVSCPSCGESYIDVIYDIKEPLDWPDGLANRDQTMWRYHELLPVPDHADIVTMGEGYTPLIHSENLGAMLGLKHLYIKDERQGPTGSFKDRQASLAISTLKRFGIEDCVVASTGNVAIAYSAYAARARIKLVAFTISSVPPEKMREVMIYGTELVKVTGTYNQAKQVAAQFAKSKDIFLDRGVRNIAAKEAMKTIAYEIAEQLGRIYGPSKAGTPWRSPDWYIQAVSGGLGPVGVAKGFHELKDFGLSDKIPKIGAMQSAGCDPMVRAWREDREEAAPVMQPTTRIATVATDVPGPAYGILREHMNKYGGLFESVTDEEAYQVLKQIAQLDGFSVEPATAIAFAGLIKLVRQGILHPDEIIVLNCTGHTFPVEKHLLGDDLIRDVDVSEARSEVPTEGLLTALETVDDTVTRVIVIEDDRGASQLMTRILQANGIKEVYQAFDGRTGIQMVEEKKPDLIVLDLMMPELDGFGVLEWLKSKERLRDVPVVVVTAKDLTVRERNRLNGQVQGLLQKGSFIDDDQLEELLGEILE